MKRISKAYFMGWIFGPFAVGMVMFFIAGFISGISNSSRGPEPVIALPVLIGLVAFIVGIVFECILMYRLWTAIQGEDARTTPGKAVGFCFIPFFNFYWIFQAYWGWAVDYNRHVKKQGLELSTASEGVGLWYCILRVSSIIPCLGYLTGLGAIVLMILFLNNAINSANALIEARGNSMHDDQKSSVMPTG